MTISPIPTLVRAHPQVAAEHAAASACAFCSLALSLAIAALLTHESVILNHARNATLAVRHQLPADNCMMRADETEMTPCHVRRAVAYGVWWIESLLRARIQASLKD